MSLRRKLIIGLLGIAVFGMLILGIVIGYRSFASTADGNPVTTVASVLYCTATEAENLCNPDLGVYSGSTESAPFPLSFDEVPVPTPTPILESTPLPPTPSPATASPTPAPTPTSSSQVQAIVTKSASPSPIGNQAIVDIPPNTLNKATVSTKPKASVKPLIVASPRKIVSITSNPPSNLSDETEVSTSSDPQVVNEEVAATESPSASSETTLEATAGSQSTIISSVSASPNPTATVAAKSQNSWASKAIAGLIILLLGVAGYALWRYLKERSQS